MSQNFPFLLKRLIPKKKNKIESITRVFSMFTSILMNYILNLKPYLHASFQIRIVFTISDNRTADNQLDVFDHIIPGGNE